MSNGHKSDNPRAHLKPNILVRFRDLLRAKRSLIKRDERTVNGLAVIVGSSPAAPSFPTIPMVDTHLIALNNAWRINLPFDFLVYPDDFPPDRLPHEGFQGSLISNKSYMPAVDEAGGMIFCGATMAFAAGYWAIMALRPRILGFFACDMIYDRKGGASHFYGQGTPDPLRQDISLGSLEGRSARLFAWGLDRGTLILNLSQESSSRLVFPRMSTEDAKEFKVPSFPAIEGCWSKFLYEAKSIRAKEAKVPFDALRHDYWILSQDEEAVATVRELDDLWMASALHILPGWEAVGSCQGTIV